MLLPGSRTRSSTRLRGKASLYLVVCLSFMALLCPLAVATPESRHPTTPPLAEAVITVPFGGSISEKTARSIARVATRVRALTNIATTLDGNFAARLGTTDPEQIRALASAIYPMTISTTVPSTPNTPPHRLVVTARIWASPRDMETDIRKVLRLTDNLELRFQTLREMEVLSEEGLHLLLRGQDDPDARPDASSSTHLDRLAGKLEARRIYLNVLNRFEGTWRGAQDVVRLLQKAAAYDPENPLLHLSLGEVLLLLDRPYEALDALHCAVKLPDTPARTFYMRGIAHLRLHLPTYAIEDFSRALKRRPEKAAWWRARGAARLVSGETETMCADFYQACMLGDCESLYEMRKQEQCLEPMKPEPPLATTP